MNNRGYGQFHIGKKNLAAHRMAWISVNGAIPKSNSYHGICVLHKCDNPKCCNPSHLFLGVNRDNVLDRESKNRGNHPTGSRHWKSKLSESDVARIRMLIGTETMSAIGKRFGVSHATVSNIFNRKSWAAA